MGKIDGIKRDPDTGIVIARRDPHPLADEFRAIPAGNGIDTVFNLPVEMRQVLAIHIFDNRDCSPPRNPNYFYVEPEGGQQIGLNGGMWLPASAAPKRAPEKVVLPDASGWSNRKIEHMKAALRQEEIKRNLINDADPRAGEPIRPARAPHRLPGEL